MPSARFLEMYKLPINFYGNWEKYCLKLLPTRPTFLYQFSWNRDRLNVRQSRNSKHFLRSIGDYSELSTSFLAMYKFPIKVYGHCEKYCLKLLPTTFYRSIFVKSQSLKHLSIKLFKIFLEICSRLFCALNALSGNVQIFNKRWQDKKKKFIKIWQPKAGLVRYTVQ